MERKAVILVGKDVAHNVALEMLDSIDPKVYRDMVSRYPDIDPDHFITGAPVNADKLLDQYARRHENSKEVLEVAAKSLAGIVYSIIGEESKMDRERALVQFGDVLGIIREQLDIVEAICKDQLNCPIKIEIVTPEVTIKVYGETWTAPVSLTVNRNVEEENKMAKQKLSPEVASRLGDWVEDTLANVDCSSEHEAAVPDIIIEDDKASIPFTYRASGVKVEGVVLFDNLDSFAETVGHYAADANDSDLLEQMISIASGASRDYLLSLKADMLEEE